MTKILGEPCLDCGKTIVGIHHVGRMVCEWKPGYGKGEVVGCLCRDCVAEAEFTHPRARSVRLSKRKK
jgi:hypothetical protein